MGALKGTRVLDFTHYIAGPYCSQILADHGADVIKVEPLNGEASRTANPMYKDSSIYFESMNRNKRTIALDLKAPSSKEIINRLVKSADILVTNYSVGVPEKLGISYEEVSKINPQIIMVHITGFGLTGPMKNDGAFDGIIQAMSGIAHLTGESEGPPLKTGLFIADHVAALQGTIGTLLALASRNRTGKGQLVDVGMLDSMVSMLAYNLSLASVFGISPSRSGNRSTNVFATIFEAKDGYLYIAPIAEKMWTDLCEVIGHPDYAKKFPTTNARLKNYDFLEEEINKWTRVQTTDEIISKLLKKRIACGKVNSIEDLLDHEQLKARDMLMKLEMHDTEIIVPGKVVKMSEDTEQIKNLVSPVGGDTEEILKEVGFTEQEISSLGNAISPNIPINK